MFFPAVLVLGFLVRTSSAGDKPLVCYNITIDSIVKSYEEGSSGVQVPTVEYDDKWVTKFAESDTEGVKKYVFYLLNDLESQAKAAGEQMINDINAACKKLDESIEEIKSKRKSNRCEADVNAVTNQFTTFLNLQPGNTGIKNCALPDFPAKPVKLKSRTNKRSLTELFLDLKCVIDADASVMYTIRTNLFLKGWNAGRPIYHDFLMRLRKEILDNTVLNAYKYAADNLSKKCDSVKNYVKPESWKSFKNAIDQVIRICNDYKVAKKNC